MTKLVLSLLAFAFLSTGCSSVYLFSGGRPEFAEVQHPAKGGVEQLPPLIHSESLIEQQRGLPPGSLSQDARVVRADPEAVCIAVTLRGLDRRYPDLRNWSIVYRAKAAGPDAEPIEDQAPNVELAPVQAQVYNGLVPETIQVGTENVCTEVDSNNNCRRWSERAVYSTQWVPGPVEVSTGGGNICFANTQHLNLNTQAIALRLNAGRGAGGHDAGPARLTFQWNFSGTTAQPVAATTGSQQARR